MEGISVNSRLDTKNIAAYNPRNKGGGRQFSSKGTPTLSNTAYLGTSFEDAIQHNSPKYRDESGTIRRIKVNKVKGVDDTYQLGDSTQAVSGQSLPAVNSSAKDAVGKTRKHAAQVSTNSNADIELSQIKYKNAKDQLKQIHHLVSLVDNSGGFEGRSEASKQYIFNELAKEGVFPGDDRRNYVAIYGNTVFNPATGEQIAVPWIDEHQAGMHGKDTIQKVISNEIMPSKEVMRQLSDDQVIEVTKLAAIASRADLQDIKELAQQSNAGANARAKTDKMLRRQTAKVIAQQVIASRLL